MWVAAQSGCRSDVLMSGTYVKYLFDKLSDWYQYPLSVSTTFNGGDSRGCDVAVRSSRERCQGLILSRAQRFGGSWECHGSALNSTQ